MVLLIKNLIFFVFEKENIKYEAKNKIISSFFAIIHRNIVFYASKKVIRKGL